MAAVERGTAAAMNVISRILLGEQDKVQREQLTHLANMDRKMDAWDKVVEAADAWRLGF